MIGRAFRGRFRLAQGGPVASPGRAWWTHHIVNTRAYLEAALAGNMDRAVAALKSLWEGVLEWQMITGSWAAGVLMAEHTALAKLLVDCLSRGAGGPCSLTAINALVANAEAHGKLFPREPARFAQLFGSHTKLAGTYIMDLGEGRRGDFERHFAEALTDGERLAAFTDEVFFGMRTQNS
jgi:hypothetical protein